jgi:hypothetical protein
MAAPVVAAVVAFLTGAGVSASAIPVALTPIAGDLSAVDRVAKTAWSYAPAICRALDPLIDKAADAEDARAGGKVTIWRQITDDLTAASDSICASSSAANTPADRLAAIAKAVAAAERADGALVALGGAKTAKTAAKPATPPGAALNGPALLGRSLR